MTLLNIYLNGDSTKKFVFLMSSSFVVLDDTGLGYVLSCPIMVIHVYVSTCLGQQKYCLTVSCKYAYYLTVLVDRKSIFIISLNISFLLEGQHEKRQQ